MCLKYFYIWLHLSSLTRYSLSAYCVPDNMASAQKLAAAYAVPIFIGASAQRRKQIEENEAQRI